MFVGTKKKKEEEEGEERNKILEESSKLEQIRIELEVLCLTGKM